MDNEIQILVMAGMLGLLLAFGTRKIRKDTLAFIFGLLVLIAVIVLVTWLHVA
jgi:hypothetical protein